MGSKVTVLLATYNNAAYLRTCIDSVLTQSYRNFEFVIVNDASTDRTEAIVRSYRDPRIRYVRLPRNLGKGKAMNIGLAKARGAYLLEIDGDDWLERDAIRRLVAVMDRQSSSVAVVYGDRRCWEWRKGVWVPTRLYKGQPFVSREKWARYYRTFGPRFYRVSALRRIKGWPTNDPSKGRLFEDYALMLRLLDHYRFHYTPQVLYHVRVRWNSVSRSHLGIWKRSVQAMASLAFRRWGKRK
ncbi:glycosyltransferase family 2 protein [Tumebacillus sp. ITR2]|uniref:Glycosyltransferase family 2 protein n=1 Tax=Tumebacillus amylolyticus TaxID=2801339 RepID=A0ABS1JE77_9BACL|nr:glycosyltransferase family 2 protein [Tumebacillus amylolyticus]MBL0388548.1 glycosyltransferase family 2 protein [Tumebacillus amylolyticus]